MIRDHLIEHVENAITSQKLNIPTISDTQNKVDLEMIKPEMNSTVDNENGTEAPSYNPFKTSIIVFIVWATFEIIAIITFIFVNKKLSPDSKEL